ncbi:MAG TPA: ABC transporter substrate-binding protein [Casimicrobiaceae bacterium]|nr:ABC transporter substrate-binding protein [Casimicrobiaceae bacterium]
MRQSPLRSLATRGLAAFAATALLVAPTLARAEASVVRISYGFGVLYLPLMVMDREHLLEKHAKAAGLPDVKVEWKTFDGGNVINDAMLSGALDIAGIGVPGFLTLWAKAKDNPQIEVRGLTGMSSSSMFLMTRNPAVKKLGDFTDKDRIAVPGIKTSLPAVLLHMAAAKEFGDANYAKLDPITVGLPHPDALAVMLSGRGEIDSHMASPPFSYIEAESPALHRVFDSVDLLGNITLDMTFSTRRFVEANPKLAVAFVAAMQEACAAIAADKRQAAQIYNDVRKSKQPIEETLKILEDPNSKFSAVPEGTMRYAEFMSRIGTIKAKPASWKDLFFAPIQSAQGS